MDLFSFRNPDEFRAGSLHNQASQWEHILQYSGDRTMVADWISNGVDIHNFMTPFHGEFRNQSFGHAYPPRACFRNAKICRRFTSFISRQLQYRLKTGAIRLWDISGKCDLPHIISPITVEPTKPRLCIHLMYLNCWMRDTPFKLDTLAEVPRMVPPDSFLTKLDDTSGYDLSNLPCHLKLWWGFNRQGRFMFV